MAPTLAPVTKDIKDTSVSLVAENGGITEKVKVYSMQTKDSIVEIVGSIGGRIVIIKAKVTEMGSGALVKAKQASLTARAKGSEYVEVAGSTLKAKTVFIQDGYVYIQSVVEGKVVYARATLVEPIKTCALSAYSSSKEQAELALQKLKPYYVRVEDGIAHIVGAVGQRVMAIRIALHARYTSVQVWTLQSVNGARTMLQGYTSPLLSKALSLRQNAAAKVDHVLVSIKDGVLHVQGMVGERVLHLQTRLSETEIYKRMSKGWQAAREATLALTAQISEIVSNFYGKGRDRLKVIECGIKDKFLYIHCQVNDRFVVIRVKVSEVVEYLRTRSFEVYTATRASISDVCWEAKTTILNATEGPRTKAIEASRSLRAVAVNPNAHAAAAGAVAGATSVGVTGLLAGGVVGAACAIPAAFFTFGLSIPVGATVGAGGGLCIGGSAGAVAGGVAGYKAHKEKAAIGDSISGAFAKAKARKDMAVDSASNLRSRVVGRIGGTAFA